MGEDFKTFQKKAKDIGLEWVEFKNKPYIRLDVDGVDLHVAKKKKISQLLELIDLKEKKEWYKTLRNDPLKAKKILKEHLNTDRVLKISCSKHDDDWWVFAFGSEHHQVVPFKEIGSVIKKKFNNNRIESYKHQRSIIWDITIDAALLMGGYKMVSIIRVVSGRNTKERSMKVIPSINLSKMELRPVGYYIVKHTDKWEQRLKDHLDKAENTLTDSKYKIKGALSSEISYSEIAPLLETKVRSELRLSEDKTNEIAECVMNNFENNWKKESRGFSTLAKTVDDVIKESDCLTEYAETQLKTIIHDVIIYFGPANSQ